MKRRHPLAFLIVAALVAACGPRRAETPTPVVITVFAAASLTQVFAALGDDFGRTHRGVTVSFNFGGSQQLAQQLAQGARADVFASANDTQMNVAVSAGRVAAGTPVVFALNRLVVVIPRENPASIARLEDLAKPGVKIVLAGKDVPVGQYTLEMLDRASSTAGSGFEDAVLRNVVSYEVDVKAVLTKVTLGEADAGVVYTSDLSQGAREKIVSLEVPDALNVTAGYPIAAVSDSAHLELAHEFVEAVRSPAGQAVLARYGFESSTGQPSQ